MKFSSLTIGIFGAFTTLNARYGFETGGDVMGEDQRMKLDMDSWLFELVASTRFQKLNFYAGLGYVTGKSDTRLLGTYELQTRTPVTFTDPFDVQHEISGLRANLGANLRLGWFGLNTAYTFQGYNNFSLGINFNIRYCLRCSLARCSSDSRYNGKNLGPERELNSPLPFRAIPEVVGRGVLVYRNRRKNRLTVARKCQKPHRRQNLPRSPRRSPSPC